MEGDVENGERIDDSLSSPELAFVAWDIYEFGHNSVLMSSMV